jgi:hypothetical protein
MVESDFFVQHVETKLKMESETKESRLRIGFIKADEIHLTKTEIISALYAVTGKQYVNLQDDVMQFAKVIKTLVLNKAADEFAKELFFAKQRDDYTVISVQTEMTECLRQMAGRKRYAIIKRSRAKSLSKSTSIQDL